MKTPCIILVLAVMVLLTETFGETAEKYIDRIIKENIAKSREYQLPVDNSEFFEGLNDSQVQDYGEFDFIIVGAGSTGAVLANRLSEINNWNILLLEAGGEEDDFSDIPAMLAYLQFSKMNWGYYSTPQRTSCLGMVNNQCNYPRGKVIGGCSTINALMYVRGNPEDFNKWEKQGNPGWAYEDVLHHFKKSENSLVQADPGYHGQNGLWNVDYKNPIQDHFAALSGSLFNSEIPYVDYNGKNQMGFSRVQYNIKEGRRQSTGRAFLDPIRYERGNLNITTNALVTKVLIDKNRQLAYGVEFIRNGQKYRVITRKEIILSAGAINTPQIMMLSGLGPQEELEYHGIETIQDLPVGKNLEDHATFYGLTFRTNTTITNNDFNDQVTQYIRGFGPLTDPGNNAIIGFMNTNDESESVPDMEYIFVTPNSTVADIAHRQYNLKKELDDYFRSINPMTDFRVLLILLHPESRGTVSLQSDSIKDFPLIDTAYLSDLKHKDINTIYRAIRKVLKMVASGPFKHIKAELVPLPVCREYVPDSKRYWFCVIRHATATLYHPTGTTRMGKSRIDSVVDHELNVHGIMNLRVADAGVMPSIVSGHTNAPAVMIGEKLADGLKAYHDNSAEIMQTLY